MLGFHEVDLLVRGGFLALMGSGNWIIWRDQRHATAARIQVLLNFAACSFIVGSIPGIAGNPTSLVTVLDTLSHAVTGLFWLFARVWFQDIARIGWRNWSIALGSTAVTALLVSTGLDQEPVLARIWFPLERGIWFVLLAWALWIAWNRREDDLIEVRRRLRIGIIATSGFFGVLFNAIEIGVFRFGAPAALHSLAMVALAVVASLIFLAMQGVRQPDLFGPVAPPRTDLEPDMADAPLVGRLLAHMEAEKPWRDDTLTIAMLAAQLGEQEYRLRRLINGALGYRNFSQFLNGYRLSEVKGALADADQRDVPILTIALDAGFGSLASFNRVFRDAEDETPSDYRRKACSIPEMR